MANIIWEGNFNNLALWTDAVDDVFMVITKMANSSDAACLIKQNMDSEFIGGYFICHYVSSVRKVVVSLRKIVVLISIDDVKAGYRTRLLRNGRITIPVN